MLGGIGVPELLIIFVIILVLFGGKKLPEMGAGLGKAIRSFKEGMSGSPEAEKKDDHASAEASAGKAPDAVRELPREADAAPPAPVAEKDKAREPARKG
jgi:sec-independent protein translocase protein TatA